MLAQASWREHPGEIASDLSRYHGLKIRDWHRGDMDSYELLELCQYLPEDSALKTAIRGDLCERDEAIRQIANEIAVLRAGMVPDADSEDYGSHLFIPPPVLRAMVEHAEEADEARDSLTPRTRED
jgi:hypothetical protein